jgi:hypothetical protein
LRFASFGEDDKFYHPGQEPSGGFHLPASYKTSLALPARFPSQILGKLVKGENDECRCLVYLNWDMLYPGEFS